MFFGLRIISNYLLNFKIIFSNPTYKNENIGYIKIPPIEKVDSSNAEYLKKGSRKKFNNNIINPDNIHIINFKLFGTLLKDNIDKIVIENGITILKETFKGFIRPIKNL